MKSMHFLLFFFFLHFSEISFAQSDTINKIDTKGNKQGYWKKAEGGILKYEGRFHNNIPAGTFKYYYPDGKIKAISTFSDQGKKSRAQLFFETGLLKAEGNYLNEKKDSLWKFYNDKQVLIAEEFYKDNKKEGLRRTYYPSGKLSEESVWKNDKRNGVAKEFFENGKLKKESFYIDDQLDGPFRVYFPNEIPRIAGKYEKNVKVGDWVEYLESGEIKVRETYKDGRLFTQKRENGEFTDYYINNIPKEIVNYKGGLRNGEFKEFYEAGEWKKELVKGHDDYPDEIVEKLEGTKIKTEGTYKNDKLHGKIKRYNLDGSINKVEEYKEGKLLK